MEHAQHASAAILPFVHPGQRPGTLPVSDRIKVLQWSEHARGHGVRAVRIHEPEPGDDPAMGPFVLIYRMNESWAAWGVARLKNGYELWRSSTGTTLGRFENISAALGAIAPAT